MSYKFISPEYQVTQCPTDGGMGFIGPDQPWTQATAGKQLVPPGSPCSGNWLKLKVKEDLQPDRYPDRLYFPSGIYNPKTGKTERIMDKTACLDTGEVTEAKGVGQARIKTWCCPPNSPLPKRAVTEPEANEHGGECQPFYHDGEEYPSGMVWVDARYPTPTGWSFRETPIRSQGYKLVCKAIRGKVEFNLDPSMIMGQARTTIEQAERTLQEKQARIAERDAIISQSEEEFQYGFFQRYGVYMLAGAGVIGLGVVAGLIKKSLSKKE